MIPNASEKERVTESAAPSPVSLDDLWPGDVLLSRGRNKLAELICAVDGGSYSHAGVWDGQCVVEATLGGIFGNPITHALESQHYVDVYRFERDGQLLGAAAWPAAPVIAQARSFLGESYAYADLLMAVVVVSLGRRTSVPAMKLALGRLGAAAGQQVAAKVFGHEVARGAKVCTQVVAAAFHDAAASPLHRYALDILVRGSGGAEAQELLDPEARAVQAEYFDLVPEWRRVPPQENVPLRHRP